MSDVRLILVTKPMAHHGARAGYNVLPRYLAPDALIRANTTTWGRWVNGATRRVMMPLTGVEWYGAAGLMAEIRAAARGRWYAAKGHRVVVHVMYGEDLYWSVARSSGPQVRVVATFHQPPSRFRSLVRRPHNLRHLDAVIALDPSNAFELERVHPGRVHTLALGVDDEYWRPGPERTGDRVLFVGNHLRDFDVLREVIVGLRDRAIAFDLVVPASRAASVRDLPRTEVHSGISDGALRCLYQNASVLLLPLTGGSANNAVLQALACGTPIVATDLPGVRSYIPDAAGLFAPAGDADAHRRAVLRLLDDPALLTAAGAAARAQGTKFSWRSVAERHRALYNSL